MLNVLNTLKLYGGLAIKLKNKSYNNANYSKLKRIIFYQVFLLVLTSMILVLILQNLTCGRFAGKIVNFFANALYLTGSDADHIYQFLLRNNMDVIMILAILILFAISFSFWVSWFVKYFDKINLGMDHLLGESDVEIILPPELAIIENKLKQIKIALEKQKKVTLDAEQRKNDLVVYLAHDIRTPLTSVIGYLSLLDEAPDMPADQKAKYIGLTLEKAYRLEQLINELFEITRFNLQAITLSKEKINLSFMLQQIADEFYPMLVPKKMQVSVDVPDSLTLWGDADKLARVFNNILKNAIAYSYENSEIKISALQQGENTIITFTNHGIPIPPQKLYTIFEKFYRLDSSRSSNTGGAGLGLAIAKEIVTAHNGTITAESNNEYTKFIITLPCCDTDIKRYDKS